VTDVEVIPGAGQWLDEITLKRLARYVLNNYLIFGPGTWREREDREASFTVQEENDLSLLYHDGNLRILSFDIKKWSLDRRPPDLSIQGRWHLTFCPETGAVGSPMVALTYGAWSQRGLGLSPGLHPSLPLSMEVSFLSALVFCPGSGTLLGGELPECSNKVLVVFFFYSYFSF
jgi:hypothetical protein